MAAFAARDSGLVWERRLPAEYLFWHAPLHASEYQCYWIIPVRELQRHLQCGRQPKQGLGKAHCKGRFVFRARWQAVTSLEHLSRHFELWALRTEPDKRK